jgi:hypothetical protein
MVDGLGSSPPRDGVHSLNAGSITQVWTDLPILKQILKHPLRQRPRFLIGLGKTQQVVCAEILESFESLRARKPKRLIALHIGGRNSDRSQIQHTPHRYSLIIRTGASVRLEPPLQHSLRVISFALRCGRRSPAHQR